MKEGTKVCGGCNEEKFIDSFYVRKSGNLCTYCKECECKRNRKSKAKTRKKYKFGKKFCDRIKLKWKCVDCGWGEVAVALHFDHVKGEKYREIWRLSQGVGINHHTQLKILKSEMRKCEVRCANCHAIKTHNNNEYMTGRKNKYGTNKPFKHEDSCDERETEEEKTEEYGEGEESQSPAQEYQYSFYYKELT